MIRDELKQMAINIAVNAPKEPMCLMDIVDEALDLAEERIGIIRRD
jgi:hypothetical protein